MLKNATADFPEPFVENLNCIIKTLKPKRRVHNQNAMDDKTQNFPGLAVQDDPAWQKKRQEDMEVADDMMAELEGLKSTTVPRNSSNQKRRMESPSPERRHHRRHQSRSRSNHHPVEEDVLLHVVAEMKHPSFTKFITVPFAILKTLAPLFD
ncbi:unnamed protein product [Mucor hiemalis]